MSDLKNTNNSDRVAELERELREAKDLLDQFNGMASRYKTCMEQLTESREREGRMREALAIAEPLARRALWIAYVWNDHNFEHPYEYARETAQKYDIYNADEANAFLDKCAAALAADQRDT